MKFHLFSKNKHLPITLTENTKKPVLFPFKNRRVVTLFQGVFSLVQMLVTPAHGAFTPVHDTVTLV
ncbi:hypothetical protein C0966_16025 [Bacillus methanolicus]|nr:hypothetical protein [Bacillus methanolicus]